MSTARAIDGTSPELQEFLSNLAVFRGLPVMADRLQSATFLSQLAINYHDDVGFRCVRRRRGVPLPTLRETEMS
jgi:hypothetical protein